jgi:hypothetical protein
MGSTTKGTFAATGSGISYTLSAAPTQSLRLAIDNGGMTYCAPITGSTGTVMWADFMVACYNPTPGPALTGAPTTATQIEFQIEAGAAVADFNFCVTALSFAP